jgi:hypothetical protein
VAYPQRFERPVRYGLVLALAANTSGYALPVVLAALAALAWELVVTKRGAWRRAEGKAAMKSTAVVLAGVIFAIVTTFPDRNSIVTGLHQVGLSDILRALWHLVREPGQLLGSTLGTRQPLVTSVALLVLAACLLGDGPVVAFFIVGAVGMSLMFDLVYASSEHRHRGIFLIFALVLLWIRFASGSPRCTHFAVLPAAALPAFVTLLFLDQLGVGAVAVADDYVHEMSSCRALGQFLRSTPELKGAIILGEPDYLLEALPYYADNDIYIPREGRFGKRVLYTTASKADMSLHELLEVGRSLKKRFGRPVLIALGSRLALSPDPPFERHYSYNKVLSFSRETYDEFFGAVSALTVLIRAPDGDENFAIYGLD